MEKGKRKGKEREREGEREREKTTHTTVSAYSWPFILNELSSKCKYTDQQVPISYKDRHFVCR